MTRVAVVGCGLIGGSLVRALHGSGHDVTAIDLDPDVCARVRDELGVPARTTIDTLENLDLVVLAQPLPALLAAFEHLARAPHAPGLVVTDVAGVKVAVLEAAAKLPGTFSFVGAHPMAGRERSGFGISDALLFQDRAVAICAPPGAAAEAIERVTSLWRSVGARPIACDAADHDEAVARVSHLPYLAAAAVATVAARGGDLTTSLAASGFRDTTRVAEDPTVRFVAGANGALPALAREAASLLVSWAEAFERGDRPDAAFDAAAGARRRLVPPPVSEG